MNGRDGEHNLAHDTSQLGIFWSIKIVYGAKIEKPWCKGSPKSARKIIPKGHLLNSFC